MLEYSIFSFWQTILLPVETGELRYFPPATWQDAEQTCIDEGGHLPSIHTDADEERLIDAYAGSPWVGANSIAVEVRWLACNGICLSPSIDI